jgi:hypothetical protein
MGPEGHETWRSWVEATLPRDEAPPWPTVGRSLRPPRPGEPPEDAGRLLAALHPAPSEGPSNG